MQEWERVHMIVVQVPFDCWIHWLDHAATSTEENYQTQHEAAVVLN